jgi:hypothetical protein
MIEPIGLRFLVWCFKMCVGLSNGLTAQKNVCFL